MLFLVIAVVAFVVPVIEWTSRLTRVRPHPILWTVIGAVAFVYALFRLIRTRRRLLALRLGRDGERLVAEELDSLKAAGALVFHDIVGPSFNVDHVVVSRHGIYAIETKTFSKKANGKVSFDGTRLLIDGRTPREDLVR